MESQARFQEVRGKMFSINNETYYQFPSDLSYFPPEFAELLAALVTDKDLLAGHVSATRVNELLHEHVHSRHPYCLPDSPAYPIAEIKRAFCIAAPAWKSAKEKGLAKYLYRVGKCTFISRKHLDEAQSILSSVKDEDELKANSKPKREDFSTREVAGLLGISKDKVLSLRRRGLLVGYDVGDSRPSWRFTRQAIDDYKKQVAGGPAPPPSPRKQHDAESDYLK